MFELAHNNKPFDVTEHMSAIEELIAEYKKKVSSVNNLVAFMQLGNVTDVLVYFFEERAAIRGLTIDAPYAIKKINSEFWSRLIEVTRLMNIMPGMRQKAWREMIAECKAPEFTSENVYSTIDGLAKLESRFFAERVDGVFRSLSKTHLTNCPEGFSKRMIFTRVANDFYYGSFNADMRGFISDLRAIVSNVFGDERDYEDLRETTPQILKLAVANYGDWTFFDGGTMKIKIFKNGNAHFEVHPEIAWQLNRQLHLLHPNLIPSSFRIKPVKKSKEFQHIDTPLHSLVLRILNAGKYGQVPNPIQNSREKFIRNEKSYAFYETFNADKTILSMLDDVMHSIGGVRARDTRYPYYNFDYRPEQAIKEIVVLGTIPNDKSYQFYPTPEEISTYMRDVASIKETDSVLEPSAGTGALVAVLPENFKNVTAVEISSVRVQSLMTFPQVKEVVHGDFMQWQTEQRFDKVLMNPPFSDGRVSQHIRKASELMNLSAILLAVVPLSYSEKIEGCETEDLKEFKNCFHNTGISVKVVKIVKVGS